VAGVLGTVVVLGTVADGVLGVVVPVPTWTWTSTVVGVLGATEATGSGKLSCCAGFSSTALARESETPNMETSMFTM
jgi:hypothetical protein